jgi:D-glycero-D-manno-heptose 1,7-bisphosphate phosphatase
MVDRAGNRAVFLDRDGVIVVPEFRDGRSFAPRRLEDFRFFPDARGSLLRLKSAGYLLIVVTNQPDVGNGLMSPQVLDEMHRRMMTSFPIEDVKACLHRQEESCACRKPAPKLLLDAAREFNIDLDASFMIGDRASDVEAGRSAGCRTVFIDLGYTLAPPEQPTFLARSLGEAADLILQAGERGSNR